MRVRKRCARLSDYKKIDLAVAYIAQTYRTKVIIKSLKET